MSAGRKLGKKILNVMPEDTAARAKQLRLGLRGLGQLRDNQAMLALRIAELEARLAPETLAVAEVPDDRFPDYVRSRLCTQAAWNEPWFTEWCDRLGVPAHRHRKTWEFTWIPEMLRRTGMLEPGMKGVGFGVGRERLVALFAAMGIEVLATDLDPTDREAAGWIGSAQHTGGGGEGLMNSLVDRETFDRQVTYQAVDMRAVPKDIQGYDFTWSTCAFEHLGSLRAGLDFVKASVETLRPGGIAVHTTEFNVSSNDATVESGPCVVYREKDLIAFKEELEAEGHQVAAFDFNRGEGLLDHYVDLPPYAEEPCLRFLFGSYTLTSVALVIRTRAS